MVKKKDYHLLEFFLKECTMKDGDFLNSKKIKMVIKMEKNKKLKSHQFIHWILTLMVLTNLLITNLNLNNKKATQFEWLFILVFAAEIYRFSFVQLIAIVFRVFVLCSLEHAFFVAVESPRM